MLGKLIPVIIGLVGLGAGVGAGLVLRPVPEVAQTADSAVEKGGGDTSVEKHVAIEPRIEEEEPKNTEFAEMPNQFVFPLVEDGDVVALVVLTLSLEVAPGQTEAVYARKPKLQDGFLRVMLDHANAGGFHGAFTANNSMERLRRALLERGREDLGDALYDVLILNINRQSV